MLTKCQYCGVSFDHKLGRCAACGTVPQPTDEERAALLAEDAAARLRDGHKPAFVRQWLSEEHHLPESLTDGVLQQAQATVKAEARSRGRRILHSGLALLRIAAAAYVFTGGILIATGCLVLGGAMAIAAQLQVITGWNLTGRDEG